MVLRYPWPTGVEWDLVEFDLKLDHGEDISSTSRRLRSLLATATEVEIVDAEGESWSVHRDTLYLLLLMDESDQVVVPWSLHDGERT